MGIDDVDPITERDKFDLQAALDLARWQGTVDTELMNAKAKQADLVVSLDKVESNLGHAVALVDAKVDTMKTWMLGAALSCLVSAAVTVSAALIGK